MRKSRIETAETRQRILSIASAMFLEQGLAAVGVRDIMAAANLTQGGFYRHFPSRERLIAEATATAFANVLAMLERQALGMPPAEALQRIVSLYLAQSAPTKHTSGKDKKPLGPRTQATDQVHLCPLSQLGVELGHCDAEVRAIARKGHRRFVRLIANQLPNSTRPESLRVANAIVSTLAGAVMLAGIAGDRATSRSILAGAQAAILVTALGRQPIPTRLARAERSTAIRT